MLKFKLLIFDFDGTIADTKDSIVRSAQLALQEHGFVSAEKEEIVKYIGIPLIKIFPLLVGKSLQKSEAEELMATYMRYYDDLAQRELKTFEGMNEILQDAKNKGAYIAVATSKRTYAARANINQLGLASFIDTLIGATDVKEHKPHPESVLRILDIHQVTPESTLLIGDTSFDIEMGVNAGVSTCAVYWGVHAPEALLQAGAHFAAKTPGELRQIIGLE